MKTKIIIAGHYMSVSKLRTFIQAYNCTIKKLQFNSLLLEFNTKKEAIKALSNAYQNLKGDETTSYSRGSSISYDAGRAYIKLE